MQKSVIKVFLIVGTLVAIFLAWQLIFNDGGIIKTAYNAVAEGINGQWEKAAGGNSKLLPLWEDSNASQDVNGKGFDIDTTG